jgi:hypothetical protein
MHMKMQMLQLLLLLLLRKDVVVDKVPKPPTTHTSTHKTNHQSSNRR